MTLIAAYALGLCGVILACGFVLGVVWEQWRERERKALAEIQRQWKALELQARGY